MGLTEDMKTTYKETAKALTGSERRVFMARIVKALGTGGQSQAARTMGWCRDTIRKGMRELDSGERIEDNFSARGRKKAEERLRNLLTDIQAIVDGQSQTDATFKSNRLYTRLSAAEVRQQLILQKGYQDSQLPTEGTIRVKLNAMGYRLRVVRKNRPQKDS